MQKAQVQVKIQSLACVLNLFELDYDREGQKAKNPNPGAMPKGAGRAQRCLSPCLYLESVMDRLGPLILDQSLPRPSVALNLVTLSFLQ